MFPLARLRIPLLALLPGLLVAEPTDFHLTAEDIPKAVLVAEKPGRMFVELTYSRDKQNELRELTSGGLPKTVDMNVGETALGGREFKSPATGYTLKFDFYSLDDALAVIGSLGWKKPDDISPVSTAGEASLVQLTADDVGRVILFLFRPDRSYIEVTCKPAKRDEIIYLLGQQPARPVLLSVDGRIIAEFKPGTRVAPAGNVRFDVPSVSLAISTARLLAKRP